MWLSKKITEPGGQKPMAELAEVTGGSAAQGKAEYRDLRLAGPWGIAYSPPPAANAVLVESTDGMACVGTLTEEKGISPGELLLYSSGGAKIWLKKNGDVVINGQVFPKGG